MLIVLEVVTSSVGRVVKRTGSANEARGFESHEKRFTVGPPLRDGEVGRSVLAPHSRNALGFRGNAFRGALPKGRTPPRARIPCS